MRTLTQCQLSPIAHRGYRLRWRARRCVGVVDEVLWSPHQISVLIRSAKPKLIGHHHQLVCGTDYFTPAKSTLIQGKTEQEKILSEGYIPLIFPQPNMFNIGTSLRVNDTQLGSADATAAAAEEEKNNYKKTLAILMYSCSTYGRGILV